MELIRSFIAFETPPGVRGLLREVQAKLRPIGADVRWERSDKSHLTLVFFGNTPARRLDEIGASISRATRDTPPFQAIFDTIGFFPDRKRPRVIWIGCHEPDGTLANLREQLVAELLPFGLEVDSRAFHPHVTIGRISSGARLDHLLSETESLTFEPGTATITELVWLKSVLRPQGAEYSLLRSIRLHAPAST